jgi:hypothetical protein
MDPIPAHLHVVTDRPRFLEARYLVSELARYWERRGIRVSAGAEWEPGAALGILHVDRTRVRPEEIPAAAGSVRLLNARVLDISKRVFSSLILARGDAWDGPVIVKSNLNHFGIPEEHGRSPALVARARLGLARLSWRLAKALPPGRYPVLPRLAAVPDWVWSEPDLLVERFVPERDGGRYCLRGWIFFGSRSYSYRLFSTHPLVKSGSMVGYEYLEGPPPPELEAIRAAHGFDFGKFDYVVVDGRVILLDANKTPTLAGDGESPRLAHLAEGVEELLR